VWWSLWLEYKKDSGAIYELELALIAPHERRRGTDQESLVTVADQKEILNFSSLQGLSVFDVP
jgi:hypothetical protein